MIFSGNISKFAHIAFLPLVLIHIIVLENIRFTLWPEMVVYPYLANNGFTLYKDLINPYPPTLTVILSALTRFTGYEIQIFQIVTWLLIFTIDIILYQVTLKITKSHSLSTTSLVFFLIISIPFGINGLWFDLVQTPFILLSVFYFYKFFQNKNSKDINLAFILAIFAFFIKQQALWLILAYVFLLTVHNRKISAHIVRSLAPSVVTFICVSAILFLYVYVYKSFSDFLNWTVILPFLKASHISGYIHLPTFKQTIPIILTFALCSPSVFIARSKHYIIFILAVSLILFVYPRFDFFHLIPSLAVISILFGLSIKYITGSNYQVKIIYYFAILLILIYTTRFISKNFTTEVRFFEPEIQSAASFINVITDKNDFLYIQNGPDQLLPLSSRLPIKPWADEFSWYLENNNLQEKIVNSMISQKPEFLIFKPYDEGAKFALGVYRPTIISDYLDKSYKDYFQLNGGLWLKKKI